MVDITLREKTIRYGSISGTKRMTECTLPRTDGRVIWITGLSGSGKSTLATEVTKHLREKDNGVVLLDGDELRKVISAEWVGNQNYDRRGRLELSMQYARLCQVISDQGLTVVISTISMFNEVYMWNRVNLKRYFEIYLKVPIGVLQHRDPKNIYGRFAKGELVNIAGLDLPVDEPCSADWAPKYEPEKTVESLTHELLEILER